MKSFLFLFWILVLGSFVGHAQKPITVAKRDSAIKLNVVHNGRYSSFIYTINNEPVTTATIKSLLNAYPKSAVEMREYRAKQRLVFLIMVPVSLAALLVGVIQANNQKDTPGSAFSKAPVPFSIYLGALVGGAIIAGKNDHYNKAIEIYNSQFK